MPRDVTHEIRRFGALQTLIADKLITSYVINKFNEIKKIENKLPSNIISPVKGSFITAAVRPTPDDPLPNLTVF